MKIGIDLDHTIIDYNSVLLKTAKQWNLLPDTFHGDKHSIKNWIQTQYTEQDWMRLQGEVYGKRIHEAQPMPDLINFLIYCRKLSIPFVIISHKTQFGHFDTSKTNLREAACAWLSNQKFFESNYIGLQHQDVYFTETRDEKLQMIEMQQCTIFIDDLLEVLMDSHFPDHVMRIWYALNIGNLCSIPDKVVVIENWRQAIKIFKEQHVGTQ